jgi:DNA polymerase-3 subunit alpha
LKKEHSRSLALLLRNTPFKKPTSVYDPRITSSIKRLLLSVQLTNVSSWSYEECLSHEKSVVGFYLSGHPTRIYQDELSQLGCTPIKEGIKFLDKNETLPSKRKSVFFLGLVEAINEKTTKEGEKFCTFLISDFSSEIECALFPKQYEALAIPIHPGSLWIFECKLKPGIEDQSLTAIVQSLHSVSKKQNEILKKIVLKVSDQFLKDSKNMVSVHTLLEKHKGTIPIYLEVFSKEHNLKIHAKLKIDGVTIENAFLKELEVKWPHALQVHKHYALAPTFQAKTQLGN